MDAAYSISHDVVRLPAAMSNDPIVGLLLRYEDVIEQIEAPDTDDRKADRLMLEAMDIEAVIFRVAPVSIEGHAAMLRFTRRYP